MKIEREIKMEKITVIESERDARELEAGIQRLFAEIAASQERMKRDQQEIERFKIHTRATLDALEKRFQIS